LYPDGLDQHGSFRDLKEMYRRFDMTRKMEDISFPVTHTVFMPVRAHKSRHFCILLPHEAVMEALSIHKKGFLEVASS